MGLFSMFRRHKNDDLSEGLSDIGNDSLKDPSSGMPQDPMMQNNNMNLGFNDDLTPQMPGPSNQNFDRQGMQQYGNNQMMSKDLELINAKLDNIKSMLESLGHRIDKMENQSSQNYQPPYPQPQPQQNFLQQRYRG